MHKHTLLVEKKGMDKLVWERQYRYSDNSSVNHDLKNEVTTYL